ncbi:sensor histidine kinase [Paenibacillus sepulcri]|uniref:Sensor histidine kinase n=1 Tax=Paenibacillus sepulcri TaxID=359917 RepID=A0ABS7C3H4_9BACL|nr:sensor histidine kinase [Paenibacillus sepulcri]
MFLVLVLLTCIPLIMLTVVAIHNAQDQLETEIMGSNLSKIEWSGTFLDDQIQILDQILFSVMNDQSVTQFMENAQNQDEALDFTLQKNLFAILSSQNLANLNRISEITVFKKENERSYSVRNGEERVLPNPGTTAPWNSPGGRKPVYVFVPDSDQFTMYRNLYRFIDRKLVGGVALQVNWSMFDPIFKSLGSDDKSTILVLDESGNVVNIPFEGSSEAVLTTSVVKRIEQHSGEHFLKDDAHYIFYQSFADGKMTIVKMIPTSVVSASSNNTLRFGIGIVTILIIVSVTASKFIADRAVSPILKLVRAITWTEETNSDIYVGHNRKDEIGWLEQKYAQIIRSRYQIYIEKRTAQLKALQAQINPHFLHNTLQSIGAMAVIKDVPEIYHIIQAISSNLRYTMGMGNDLVTLQQEFDHVSNYLVIQKFRIKDKITVEWEIDPFAADCLIPPLTLQPIVENAFEHGFQHKRGRWIIGIRTRCDWEKLYIEITDNGTGLSPQRELELKQSLMRNIEEIIEIKESMALSNIQARIKTQFGSEYGLEIESTLHGGTQVTIVIPNTSVQGGGSNG